MSAQLTIQNISNAELPEKEDIVQWVESAINSHQPTFLTLRVVDSQEIQALNATFRHMDKPTNVLSFPNPAPPEFSEGFLGDMVICASILEQEAKAQSKPLKAHWAHMIIHSVLHLQGYDHENADDAQKMESLEIKLLKQLGFENPYFEDNHG